MAVCLFLHALKKSCRPDRYASVWDTVLPSGVRAGTESRSAKKIN